MRRTLHEHIIFLEQKLQELGDHLTRPGLSRVERESITRETEIAKDALQHFRKAYELEQKLKARDVSTAD